MSTRPFGAPRRLALLSAVALVATPLAAQRPRTAVTAPATPSSSMSTAPAARMTPADSILAVEGYVTPPEPIRHLVMAPRESIFTYTTASPASHAYLIHRLSDGLPTLARLGRPHYNLGGFQVDRGGNRARTMTTNSGTGLDLYQWGTGKTTHVMIPAGARVSDAAFSPDGSTLAFVADFDNGTQIWLADPATGKTRPLTSGTGLLATYVQNFEWAADSKSIVTVLVPDGRGAEPTESAIADHPLVRVNDDRKLHTEFFPSLLESPQDEALLTYYTTGQLAMINVATRKVQKIGAPGMIERLDASPTGQYFRVTYLDQPFAYILPVSSFGSHDAIIDQSGKQLATLDTREIRLQDRPADSTGAAGTGGGRGGANTAANGRRNLTWDPVSGGLLFVESETPPATSAATPAAPPNGGRGRGNDTTRARRDRVVEWLPPFDTSAASVHTIYTSRTPIAGMQLNADGTILFLDENTGGMNRSIAVFRDHPDSAFTVMSTRAAGRGGRGAGGAAFGGRGGRGGGSSLVTTDSRYGFAAVLTSDDHKYVYTERVAANNAERSDSTAADSTASDTTVTPAFVDRIDIRTGTRERIYETKSTTPENIETPLDDDFGKMLVTRQSATVVPQSYVVDTKSGEAKQLTDNHDVMPEMAGLIHKHIVARRADGYTFKIAVTLPADWKPGTRLPALFWFYPREYNDQQAYDRSTTTGGAAANRFPTYGPRTMSFITFAGYALVEPDAPIFAENNQLPNDHYVDNLRDDLYAAIDALDTLGLIDRTKLAIGGHSYGAFSTANAMVHTPFFKAGIAGDGDYNRSLTPTGFQNERRDLWQARSTYIEMSPFFFADQLNGALLMYHSLEDQNVGTNPVNSIRMFHALQSLGKTTALYMYPYEDHGPVTAETDLDQWARWVAWLDKYVKNSAGTAAAPAVVAEPNAGGR